MADAMPTGEIAMSMGTSYPFTKPSGPTDRFAVLVMNALAALMLMVAVVAAASVVVEATALPAQPRGGYFESRLLTPSQVPVGGSAARAAARAAIAPATSSPAWANAVKFSAAAAKRPAR